MKPWHAMSDAERDEWAAAETARERAEQGLPPTIEDPATLHRLGVLLAMERHPSSRKAS